MKNKSLTIFGTILVLSLFLASFASAHSWFFDYGSRQYNLTSNYSYNALTQKYSVVATFNMDNFSPISKTAWCAGTISQCCPEGYDSVNKQCRTGMSYMASDAATGWGCCSYTDGCTKLDCSTSGDFYHGCPNSNYISSIPLFGKYSETKTFETQNISDFVVVAMYKTPISKHADSDPNPGCSAPIGIKPTLISSCGNNVCENGETSLNCAQDCGSNENNSNSSNGLNVTIIYPTNNQIINLTNNSSITLNIIFNVSDANRIRNCTANISGSGNYLFGNNTPIVSGNNTISAILPIGNYSALVKCITLNGASGNSSISFFLINGSNNGNNSNSTNQTNSSLPGQPGNLSASVTNSTINWSWTNNNTNYFNGTIVYFNGTNQSFNSSINYFYVFNLSSNTSYNITIWSTNSLGNISAGLVGNATTSPNNQNNNKNDTNEKHSHHSSSTPEDIYGSVPVGKFYSTNNTINLSQVDYSQKSNSSYFWINWLLFILIVLIIVAIYLIAYLK